ncbi:MAG: hypothetical protein ACYSW7_12535 [Planctomycetota bacterium]|jgi:hypothetical protein
MMMKRLIKSLVGILVVLLAGAKLQLVENFEGMSTTASPDGQPCTGVMGGTLDTQSEGTGNIDIVDYDGSRVVTVIGHSSGNDARAFGFNGITNPIDSVLPIYAPFHKQGPAYLYRSGFR